MTRLRIGTRGSALALAQSNHVKARLEALSPDVAVDLVIIKTTGDKMSESALGNIGGKGVFIKEIEEALLDQRVDLAVHSLKDVPTDLAPGLALSAVLEREDPRDCLVSRFGEQLLELPRGAVVGTSSLRRQAQIRAAKKGLRVEDLRGNLDTRLAKVTRGDVDAAVVAYAGVRRLGRAEEVSEVIPLDMMLPAPGQGFVTIETRRDDAGVVPWVARLNDAAAERAARAERSFLEGLGGGCRVPFGAHAREENGRLVLDGLVISVDGKDSVRGRREGDPTRAAALGAELARELIERGALAIIETLAK
ncbi:MAG: hydroxymethylbilane synthase [Dokdonella sp.]|jgi:hydroxymethylbilane synthase|nr:MAG: hydroxymethylbilane synthase [Dokdonella sp.]